MHHPEQYKDFRKELAAAYDQQHHPNLAYFVLKRILLDNLYGVDIMPEAVEVCKLRLFLKLAAQVDPGGRLEPLPDVDFNVRAGNALVGYATREDALRGLKVSQKPGTKNQGELVFEDAKMALDRIATALDDVARATRLFREQQTEHGGMVTKADKDRLKAETAALTSELDTALAIQYGVDADDPDAFGVWESEPPTLPLVRRVLRRDGRRRLRCRHWQPALEIEYTAVRKTYHILNYVTESSGNLYAFCIERCLDLCRTIWGSGLASSFNSFSFPSG